MQAALSRLSVSLIVLTCVLVPSGFATLSCADMSPARSLPAVSAEASRSDAGIETTIGQLQTSDEAALRQPLEGMNRAEREFQASPDPRYEQQLSWWADRFSARLAELTIPERTRTALAIRLAAYERGALAAMEAVLTARRDILAPRHLAVAADTNAG
jgi:hypothetical protein